jgi:hypothetical protein
VPLSKVPKPCPTIHPAGSARSTFDRPARHGVESAPLERSVHSQLAGRLGREIVGGLYPACSLLPNAVEMCARYSVSRTALREAYSVLAAKARPKVGTRVPPTSGWNMLDQEMPSWRLQSVQTEDFMADVFVLRQMVEPAAAAVRSSGTLEPEEIDALSDDAVHFSNHDFHSSLPYLAGIASCLVRSESIPESRCSLRRKAGWAPPAVIMAMTRLASRGSRNALCGLSSARTSKTILSVS